jgi:predicted dehydrogenase
MSLSEVKAGVVGIGFIGVAHVEALRRLGVEVTGVVGSSPERARAKAEALGIGRVYDDVEEMAADPSIDVIHIASPNYAHADQTRVALASGKHVVCEKPLAVSSKDTADLVGLAAGSGLVNAVCFNIRFYPANHQAMAMVASGDIGEPRFITAVADIGSHWLDLSRFVSGRRVVEVMADLHTLVPVRRHPAGPVETFAAVSDDEDLVLEEMSSDDAAGVLLRYEDGARGAVTISQVSGSPPGRRTRFATRSPDPIRQSAGSRETPTTCSSGTGADPTRCSAAIPVSTRPRPPDWWPTPGVMSRASPIRFEPSSPRCMQTWPGVRPQTRRPIRHLPMVTMRSW